MAQSNIINKKPEIFIKKTTEQMRAYDNEPVRGMFKNEEAPGYPLKFSYKKYKKDPVRDYILKDGEIRTLPRGVAKHLRTAGLVPVHVFQTDIDGNSVAAIGSKKRRYTFESLGFFDDEEDLTTNDPKLYTVEKL